MYLDFFGLQRKPFELVPDPAFLHLSKRHSLALHLLEYGVYEQTGIIVISGEVGSGKTTLIQHMLYTIDDNSITIGLINNTHETLGDVAQWIALSLGIPIETPNSATLFKNIQNFVIDSYAKGKRVLIIVDEAQNLSDSCLEQLRLFSNINNGVDFLFQILLVGQPEIKEKLSQANMSQIAQRVSVEFHLEPLDWHETKNYIAHRLDVAGTESKLFDDYAVGAIFFQSGGLPRLINTLCDQCLAFAYAKNETFISLETAIEVIKSRFIGGVNRSNGDKQQAEIIRARIKEKHGIDLSQLHVLPNDTNTPNYNSIELL